LRGTFYGVGVGPGDPDLVTLKAIKVLKRAEVVLFPSTGRGKESIALAIAKDYIPEGCTLSPVFLPMTRDKEKLEKAWDHVSLEIAEHLDQGRNTVFLTVGDPMLYSTYIYLFSRIKTAGYSVQTVPGVPSFCAAASAAGLPLGEGDEKIAIIPWNAGESLSAESLDPFSCAVFLKVSSDLTGVLQLIREGGFFRKGILVSRCGHDNEHIETDLSALEERNVDYFSLILARKEES
jgi:precorrin-2/cobalt-factor-2 C20-methyltransferase